MEKQNRDILDIIEDGIQEAFRRFRIEEAKKEAEKSRAFQLTKRHSRVRA